MTPASPVAAQQILLLLSAWELRAEFCGYARRDTSRTVVVEARRSWSSFSAHPRTYQRGIVTPLHRHSPSWCVSLDCTKPNTCFAIAIISEKIHIFLSLFRSLPTVSTQIRSDFRFNDMHFVHTLQKHWVVAPVLREQKSLSY